MEQDKRAYSYCDDPAAPELPDGKAFIVIDGDCALCSRGARWVARSDHADRIMIVPAGSGPGSALLRHYGLDPKAPDSWLFLEGGAAHTSLDAIIRLGRRLGGRWRLFDLFAPLPRGLKDWLYQRVARNRYALFGRNDLCALPDPEVQRRLLQ